MTAELYAFPALEGLVVAGAASPMELAAEIVERARVEADALREQAFAEGFAQGLAAGSEDAAARGADVARALAAAAAELERRVADEVRAIEEQAADLALAIAERILDAALEVRPELVAGVVSGTLRANGAASGIVLEVAPDDFDLVRASLAAGGGGTERIEVIAQPDLGRGGCIVSSTQGETDGRLEVQLSRAREVVFAALSEPARGR